MAKHDAGKLYVGSVAEVVESLGRPGRFGPVVHFHLAEGQPATLWQLVEPKAGRLAVAAWRLDRRGRRLWRAVPVSGRRRPSVPGELLAGLRWCGGGPVVKVEGAEHGKA